MKEIFKKRISDVQCADCRALLYDIQLKNKKIKKMISRIKTLEEFIFNKELPKGLEDIEYLQKPPILMSNVPSSGIYFLCNDNEIVYIGQSNRLLSRIGTHLLSDMDFNKVFILPYESGAILREELRLIRKFKPRYNRTGVYR